MKKKNQLFSLLILILVILSCSKEKQENANSLRQIVKSEDSTSIDISQGYARLYVLLHDSSHMGGSLSILQKTLSTTCFTGDILANIFVTINRIHRVVANYQTSPIHGKLEEGHYYMFFVKKGYKYEVLIESSGGTRRSCIPFTDNTDEFFSQHW